MKLTKAIGKEQNFQILNFMLSLLLAGLEVRWNGSVQENHSFLFHWEFGCDFVSHCEHDSTEHLLAVGKVMVQDKATGKWKTTKEPMLLVPIKVSYQQPGKLLLTKSSACPFLNPRVFHESMLIMNLHDSNSENFRMVDMRLLLQEYCNRITIKSGTNYRVKASCTFLSTISATEADRAVLHPVLDMVKHSSYWISQNQYTTSYQQIVFPGSVRVPSGGSGDKKSEKCRWY
jgi:hypothetical protein